MTKRDDRVGLVDMLVYADEAVDILGDCSLAVSTMPLTESYFTSQASPPRG